MALPRLPLVILGMVTIAVACANLPAPTGSPGPSPTPSGSPTPTVTPTATATPTPSPSGELSPAELRYELLAQFAPISWCDPDFYPIAHQDEQVSADQHWPEIIADGPTYAAIVAHLGIADSGDPASLGPAERLAIYRDWKLLNAVRLEPLDGSYVFDLITETNVGLGEGIHSAGTIDDRGNIDVQVQERASLVACPICLARGTLIDTPGGPVAVENVGVGDLVWTLDATGRRVAQPVVQVGSTRVPASHLVVRLVLDDGRATWVSPGHPTADGRTVGQLRPGDEYDGATVTSAELVAYAGGATYDILPGGGTGFYWAGGILLASTLHQRDLASSLGG
jgi:hypothetical protein